jgi:uncharacterized protein
MSQENVEIVRGLYEAWQRGDFEAGMEPFDEDVEWFNPPEAPGSGSFRGREGVRHAMASWIGAWVDFRFELRELIDHGDEVLACGWQHGRGKGSGVDVSEESFSVWTLRANKIVRQRMFRDKGQALEAAGVSE